MAKLIRNWEELAQVEPNDKYRIVVNDYCGWICPICDEPDEHDFTCNCPEEYATASEYFKEHVYLSTHTFYGSKYEWSTMKLQEYGFDVELDNWDK